MRNYKFKMSDMIPNSWFHKLKDMTKNKNKPPSSSSYSNTCKNKKTSSQYSLPRHTSASYISNHKSSPRNSLHTRTMSTRKTLYKPSPLVSAGFKKSKTNRKDSSDLCFSSLEISPESFVYSFYEEKDDEFVEPSNFITKNNKHKVEESGSAEKSSPASNPIKKLQKNRLSVKITKEVDKEDEYRTERESQKKVSSGRKSSAGINLKRVNSPRIQLSGTRRSMSRSESKQVVLESFAVMKRSVDPKKDFKESMVEMIEENNIRASKDLEDLLACYLTLNPKEYHDLIIQVFEQIWRQLTKPK